MALSDMPWSKHFNACVSCGQTDTKYMAKGLCARCYSAAYAKQNSERVKAQKHAWYIKQGGKAYGKILREERYYDSRREAVLVRDGFKCTACPKTTGLVVHHKDGKGRSVTRDKRNNSIDNLVTLCRACHIKAHRQELYVNRKGRQPITCRCCLRKNQRHASHGLCGACYARIRRKGMLFAIQSGLGEGAS